MRPRSTPATVAFLDTPPGRGGIAVVRVVGPRALAVARDLYRPRRGWRDLPARGRLGLGEVGEATGQGEEAVVRIAGSRSVEVCVHGGQVSAERVLAALESRQVSRVSPLLGALASWRNGGRHTLRWETRQALVHSRGARGLSLLASPEQGRLEEVVRQLVHDTTGAARRESGVEEVAARMARLRGGAVRARRLLVSCPVTLVGPVNAGKSTLLNRLCGRDRMVVSPEPGTTREAIGVEVELGGCGFRMIDTPGFRETESLPFPDPVGSGGGVTLLLLDGDREPTEAEARLARELRRRENAVVAVGKADRAGGGVPALDQESVPPVRVSPLTGIGIPSLIGELLRTSGAPEGEGPRPIPVAFTSRQVRLLGEAFSDGGLPRARDMIRALRRMLCGPPEPDDAVLGGL